MSFITKLADFSWQKVILIAIGLCGLYYVAQYDDGTQLQGAINERRTTLETEQKKLDDTKAAMKNLEKFKENLNNQQAEVREVLSFLPRQMNVAELVTTIQDRANQAGMRLLKTEPKDTLEKIEFYEFMKIDVQMQGTYPQIATFLSLISKLPRLVTVETIQLNRPVSGEFDPENPKIEFKATLVGFRYADDQKDVENTAATGGAPSGQQPQ